MRLLIHGDNIVQSRHHLTEQIANLRKAGAKDVIRLDGKTITLTDLRQALESGSLFGSAKLVVIERLLSHPRSKEKTALINLLAKSLPRNEDIRGYQLKATSSIILWEDKPVTATNLKLLKSFSLQLFKTPKSIFTFLDALLPKNPKITLTAFHQAINQEAPELVFYLLHRRVADLIVASDPKTVDKLPSAPWQKSRLRSQSQRFSPKELIRFHHQLLHIDTATKTGKNILPLASHLDLLLAKL